MTKKWKDVAWPFSPNEANAGQEEGEAYHNNNPFKGEVCC